MRATSENKEKIMKFQNNNTITKNNAEINAISCNASASLESNEKIMKV